VVLEQWAAHHSAWRLSLVFVSSFLRHKIGQQANFVLAIVLSPPPCCAAFYSQTARVGYRYGVGAEHHSLLAINCGPRIPIFFSFSLLFSFLAAWEIQSTVGMTRKDGGIQCCDAIFSCPPCPRVRDEFVHFMRQSKEAKI